VVFGIFLIKCNLIIFKSILTFSEQKLNAVVRPVVDRYTLNDLRTSARFSNDIFAQISVYEPVLNRRNDTLIVNELTRLSFKSDSTNVYVQLRVLQPRTPCTNLRNVKHT